MADSASPDYFAHLRENYTQGGLREEDLAKDPLAQFAAWFSEAVAAGIREPNAMTLATVAPDGSPDARIVLLKDVSPAGFSFFTNYASAKGRQLAAQPHATLVFFWATLERQVRIRGVASRLAPSESVAYFATRPRMSQLGAWASAQSTVIASRDILVQAAAEAEARFAGRDVECPPDWGGYRLAPREMEFWQGRESRLHDRLLYRKQGNAWSIERLSP